MSNKVYEGKVNVDDKRADGSKLVIGKGDRKGEPYYKLSFKVDDEWVNLMDFEGVTGGRWGDYRVEYYQKYKPNGEPELYNGKPQYALVDISPLEGAAPATQSASPASSAAPRDDSRQESIQRQTAAKCASTILAAQMDRADKEKCPDPSVVFDNWFDHILTRIEGDPVAEAKAKLDAVEEDENEIPF